MIHEIQHETRLEYSAPVTEWLAEFRMEPVSDADQSCRSFHLATQPSASTHRFRDGFGNNVHHFNLLAPVTEVRVLAASIVETHRRARPLESARAPYPVDIATADLEVLDFLKMRGPIRPTPRLDPVLHALRPSTGQPLGEVLANVLRYIKDQFQYAKDVTLASSPIDDVLEQGRGVCQDFAHLMIGVLRQFAIPARYVSGYHHRPNMESQSHAWVEAWLPELGWLGVDPTNDCVVNEEFVKVAIGRDFTDVPPNKGVYRGDGKESMSVRVETRTLESLPSRSWQEQLPPLHIPLSAILPYRPRLGLATGSGEETSDQQQQQ